MRPHTCDTTLVLGSVCLEEHRPGLRRDDRDEAEHEVHLGPDLGHLRDFDPRKRRRRDEGTSDAAGKRRARTCG